MILEESFDTEFEEGVLVVDPSVAESFLTTLEASTNSAMSAVVSA